MSRGEKDSDAGGVSEREAAIEADLAETHPDMRPCIHCGKPEREHSYIGNNCLPRPVYTPITRSTGGRIDDKLPRP